MPQSDSITTFWGILRGCLKDEFTFSKIKDIVGTAGLPVQRLSHLMQGGFDGATKEQLMCGIDGLFETCLPPQKAQVLSAVVGEMIERREALRERLETLAARAGLRLAENGQLITTGNSEASSELPKYSKLPMAPPSVGKFLKRTTETRKVFVSYSHGDQDLLKELNDHLSPLKREDWIECWDDREMPAGSDIDANVVKKIEAADIILLLVSRSFMASEYIWKEEVSRAIRRHQAGDAIVVPIILRECDWHSAFGKIKALPHDGKAVTSSHWKNHDAAFNDIAQGLRQLIKAM